jgi:transcriptional regulator with XRE-family HTH domain
MLLIFSSSDRQYKISPSSEKHRDDGFFCKLYGAFIESFFISEYNIFEVITMDNAKIGSLIRSLRTEKGMTQKELADKMKLSDKTISKWERGCGGPDLSLLTELSALLGVNIENILNGQIDLNDAVGGNMKKSKYFVCPACGNLTVCTGNAAVSCCGRKLNELKPQKAADEQKLTVEAVEDEWFISSPHPMTKSDYISFIAFVTGDKLQIIKLYPEWDIQTRLPKREHGTLLWYSKKNGLFYQYI